jgi:hypothetical protein
VWYWLYEYFMPHTVSLLLCTLFLYLWLRWRESGSSILKWFVLGIVAGCMAMGRWQDSVFVLVAAFDELPKYFRAIRAKDRKILLNLFIMHALFIAGAILAFTPQLIFWKVMFGRFTGFLEHYRLLWTAPNFVQVLYSYNRGLLTWTPIITVCLIGLLFWIRNQPRIALLMLVGFLGELYVNSSNSQWWSGASFGARRFTACFLPFALGMAEALRLSLRNPGVVVTIASALFVLFNISAMRRAAKGDLKMEGITDPESFLSGNIEEMRNRTGVSPTFPFSTVFGLRHDVPPGRYDELLSLWRLGNWKVDLGESDDSAILGYGWGDPEKTPGGLSVRWSKGRASTLLIPLVRATNYDLAFMAQPYHHESISEVQRIEIFVNDHHAGTVNMGDSLQEYKAFISAEYWESGINEIRFEYGYASIPQKLGNSKDQRELAVLFDWIGGSVRRQ